MNAITKNFVTIVLIQNLDTALTDTVPKDVVELAKSINKKGGLMIESD